MTKRTAKFEAQWDEETEKALEKKANKWAKSFSNNRYSQSSGGGLVYCLGLIGAAIYFISTATSFLDGVVGVLKALVWPAYFVYEIFKFLNL